jgi:hypothetical protein
MSIQKHSVIITAAYLGILLEVTHNVNLRALNFDGDKNVGKTLSVAFNTMLKQHS